eukprot:CAMPEP_0119050552 /NCGR_PEP_ID=MMETSP1177-20130426/70557_1 /TAXON_ID=2985 /ORGANISM="Ochromonas sp, Strain CCMP1899" /LENGTH=1251 /DNA_ID=CAMNT_0007029085 /DNA_START=438 /DNA_END=4193 /DNA_ORIENTATION=-
MPELKINVADLGVDVRNNFEPVYVPLEGKLETLKRLKKLSEQCSRILLATDEDREGEAISWHLVEALQPKVPFKRAVFHEITKDAILKSFENPREIDMNIVQSQETRRILDRLTGYTISPVLWRYVAPGLSAGRVQSCGLQLITERERRRWEFSESHYFSMRAAFAYNILSPDQQKGMIGHKNIKSSVMLSKLHTLNGQKVAGEPDFDGGTGELRVLTKKGEEKVSLPIVLDRDIAQSVSSWLISPTNGPVFVVSNVIDKKFSKKPPSPFITSTLQQECSKRLNMNPTRCMSIAQELYEEGFITYMRTDSPALSTTASDAARSFVLTVFGEDYLEQAKKSTPPKVPLGLNTEAESNKKDLADKPDKPDKSPKNAQNAHEAIRPAEAEGRFKTPDETLLSGEKKMLYGLIYRRTLASVMQPSVAFTKTYTIETTDDAIPGIDSPQHLFHSASFRSSETVTTFQGFKAALFMPDDGTHTHDDADPLKSMRNLFVGKVVVLTEDQPDEDLDEDQDEGDNDSSPTNTEDGKEGKDEGEGDGSAAEKNPEDGEVASSILSKGGIIAMQHVTRPPSRFSQASFIKELEIIGVGRPSTYAKIFQILKERGYVHVDGQTLIPTLKGLIVAAWLAKHFPDLVEPQFTASMEDSLDRISQGTEEKQKFLSDFYLGDPGEENSGLLSRVAQKLVKQEIDHKESRTLSIPFLKDVGVVQLGSSGAFIESKLSPLTSLTGGGSILDTDVANAISLIEGEVTGKEGEGEKSKTTRWKLPEAMQIDIRQVTKEAVELVMATETTMQGFNVGEDPITGRPVILRSGRFGRYMQIGLDSEKNRSTHSVPQWLETTASLINIMAFSQLPKVMCVHPVLELPIVMDVANKQLCVGIEGYPVRIPLPEGTLVSVVTDEMAISLLSDTNAILESQRNLGVWNEEDVVVKQGRFGYYVRCGKLIAGLRQVDPATLVLEGAIDILQTRGKLMGSKKKKGKDKKVTKKTSAIKKLSGYQIFISEVMKGGLKMGEAGVKWKALDTESQEVYRARALESQVANTPSAVYKPIVNKKKKNPTGYQIYVSEIMKLGVKMVDAATRWKELDTQIQQTYKDKSSVLSLTNSEGLGGGTMNSIKPTKPNIPAVKRNPTGYQLYTSQAMKGGVKMAEAAAGWKALDLEKQQMYRDMASTTSVEDTGHSHDQESGTTVAGAANVDRIDKKTKKVAVKLSRNPSGYQIYSSEVMKTGVKMNDVAPSWRLLDETAKQVFKDKAGVK